MAAKEEPQTNTEGDKETGIDSRLNIYEVIARSISEQEMTAREPNIMGDRYRIWRRRIATCFLATLIVAIVSVVAAVRFEMQERPVLQARPGLSGQIKPSDIDFNESEPISHSVSNHSDTGPMPHIEPDDHNDTEQMLHSEPINHNDTEQVLQLPQHVKEHARNNHSDIHPVLPVSNNHTDNQTNNHSNCSREGPTAPQFQMIPNGTCTSFGLFPINNISTCEIAARYLDLEDTHASITALKNRPEGCYYFNGGTLWFTESKVNVPGHGMRKPICQSRVLSPVQVGIDYNGSISTVLLDIPNAEDCSVMCQGDPECWVWTWQRRSAGRDNSSMCYLRGPELEEGNASTVNDTGIISGSPFWTCGTSLSLFCFSLIQPQGYEKDLISLQHKQNASIFACEEHAVYSSTNIEINPGLHTAIVHTNLTCGLASNPACLEVFIHVWKKVISDGRFRFHDWTVKVDPDAVFFPERLHGVLQHHKESKMGVFLINCRFGLHSAIQVFSRNAMRAYASSWHRCIRGPERLHFELWGKDMFMDRCLSTVLKVKRVKEWSLLNEARCDSKDWNMCESNQVTFHPFKTVKGYHGCLANASTIKLSS